MSAPEGGKPKVGYIGLGYMGSRMAARLLEAGYPLTVWNRTREKAEPLEKKGAKVAGSPKELAQDCDIVLSCLANDEAVREAILGPNGALSGGQDGALFVEMSTVLPETARAVHKEAKRLGLSEVDAPVSGSTPQAEQGSLVIFVGGEEDACNRAAPILQHLGQKVIPMGKSGSGAAMKLVVNTLLGLCWEAVAEAIVLGEKSGLPRQALIDVLGQTTVITPAHKLKLPNAQSDEFPTTFPIRLMTKDYNLIMHQAATLDVPMPATAAAQQVSLAENAKGVEEDYTAVIGLLRRLAGIE